MQDKLIMEKIPQHIAIIMDGNGRWAKRRGLPRVMGHKTGMDSIRAVVTTCSDLGVKILTVYAFSTENWNRPKDEVSFLMNLLIEYMRKNISELSSNNVKVKILGDMSPLPTATRDEIANAVRLTENNTGLQFNIALNYGGRAEIIGACKLLAEAVKRGELSSEQITDELFAKNLYTSGEHDPDLIIRTSGEKRLSNFLLWQGAYSELVFSDEYWPDFRRDSLIRAIAEYQSRDRRFGGLK